MKKTYLILTLLVLTCTLDQVIAQSMNRSDFHVPPPLAPASTTKGNVTGKTVPGKTVILTLSNIPSFGMPPASSAQIPELAAVGASAPLASQPEQPMLTDVIAGLPQIPMPAAPEAPAMPKRTLQDAPIPSTLDIPVPAAPDLPEFPKEPVTSAQSTVLKGGIPVMPDVFTSFSLSIPSEQAVMTWATPGIPENTGIKFLLPEGSKTSGPRNQRTKKVTGGAPKTQ